MSRYSIAGWEIEFDKERTQATYASIDKGGCEACNCPSCRNFSLVAFDSFPLEILEFLQSAGIDIRKDAEIYSLGKKDGNYLYYAGEFYFWGRVVTEPTANIDPEKLPALIFVKPTSLAQEEFQSDEALGMYFFEILLPWKLDEPIP